jgi:hypothetical protein
VADSSDPITSADYKAKVARYKASKNLTAEMLTATGGDIQIASGRPTEPKTRASIKVTYHVGVDQERVNELVKEVGSLLVAGVDAQIAQGRPPQAMTTKDGIHLFACSRASAREQGMGIACLGLERRYYLIEWVKRYVDEFYSWKDRLSSQPDLGPALDDVSPGATRAPGG